MNRDAFALGRGLLIQMQLRLKYPPKRKRIPRLVKKLVRKAGLRHDVRRRYFELLASCALLGKEPMYQFKRRRHVKRKDAEEDGRSKKESSERSSTIHYRKKRRRKEE